MEPQKSYSDYMYEFSPSEIYDGLMLGLFPEKLPPVFTAENFLRYSRQNMAAQFRVDDEWRHYVHYENMRNLNRPRIMGIADPFGYENMCRCLKESWRDLQKYFYEVTRSQQYKVSRLHVRKMTGTDSIFKMNYHAKAWNQDPVPDLRIDARYMIRADISSCFPSIYTHSLPWALVGKETAKRTTRDSVWYNFIDQCASHMRDGETTGLMIGNHASNILSEIVLCKVDEELCAHSNEYNYIRNIDDYECYADNRNHAEKFLVDLKDALGKYNLRLNYEKTKIVELPAEYEDSWVRKLAARLAILPDGVLPKKNVEAFIGGLVELLRETNNASVVYYAMKALRNRVMNEDARLYYLKYMAHLAVLYPYLYGYFDKYLFEPFDVRVSAISDMADRMIAHAFEVRNYEEASFALYFAVRYGFNVHDFDVHKVIDSGDAVMCAMALLYARRRGLIHMERDLVAYAKTIAQNEKSFQEQWIFAYEALPETDVPDEWKHLKRNGVTFIKDLDSISPACESEFEAERIDWSLSLDLDQAGDEVRHLVDGYLQDLPARFDQAVAKKYLIRIVANLWKRSLIRKAVCIPKEHHKYYWSDIRELGEAEISISLLKHSLRWLRSNRYIGERLGIKGEESSRYWPREGLFKIFSSAETSILITCNKPFSEVVQKDAFKMIVPRPNMSDKAERYRECIKRINKLYSEHAFSCRLDRRSRADAIFPRLKAVFNNGSWDEGGRLYASGSLNGIDYQCIPSDMRPSILIDGNATVELDYSGLHVNMLYAEKDFQLEGDPYDFLPNEQRALAKFAMLVVINAQDEEQALHALEKRRLELMYATGLSKKKEGLRRAFLLNDDLGAVINKLKAAHSKISEFFFSGYALKLQNRDSEMALEIVSYFCDRDIPVLPVHDSFIIEATYKDELKSQMDSVYGKYNKMYYCEIK